MTWQIHRYKTVDSTMEIATPLPIGSVVVADEQTAGIGRHGHSWDSGKDAGLYVSIVLPPHPVLTLALGLAAQNALRKVTSLECDIRWPNDLMLGKRKLGGILVQLHDAQLHDGRAVAGIGVNIGQQRFPDDLAAIATSLFIETGLEFRRDDLLEALLQALTTIPPQEQVIEQWQARSTWAKGKAVRVEAITGITIGLNPAGYLLVRTPDGKVETIIAGGVREG